MRQKLDYIWNKVTDTNTDAARHGQIHWQSRSWTLETITNNVRNKHRHALRFGRIRTLTTIRHERGNRHRHRHCASSAGTRTRILCCLVKTHFNCYLLVIHRFIWRHSSTHRSLKLKNRPVHIYEQETQHEMR